MYAYTIVGINYSWELGECQFLIVDPHYTEENSFKQIVSKEGVYWRDKSKLFKKGVYYNFCLPQVPIPLWSYMYEVCSIVVDAYDIIYQPLLSIFLCRLLKNY
jgi:hypothetical protein